MIPADFLVACQNPDGGWGYKRGGMSYVEPTAAVLLAFQTVVPTPNSSSYTRGIDFLRTLQLPDGGWGIAGIDDASGWMTGWAIWALARADPAAAGRGAEWLLGVEVLRTTDPVQLAGIKKTLNVDASLRGWPWQALDASWTFPTALALLALHALERTSEPRVQEGIRFLIDRAIPSGGWNVGNPFMLGAELPATIVNTALVLIALKRLALSDATVTRGYDWVKTRMGQARTAPELAHGLWALREMGADVDAIAQRLNALQRPDGSWDGNPYTTAVAMLALGVDHAG